MENKKNDRWYILGCLAALLILVIIDQWSKELAVHGLKDRDTIVLIPGVFELFYLENRGAAFGIFENMRWMFLLFMRIVRSIQYGCRQVLRIFLALYVIWKKPLKMHVYSY